MTTQEKLKIITDNIRQKLPRLMELEEGCLIRDKEIDVIYTIIEKDDKFQLLFVNGNNCFSFDFFKSRFEVIGKEPILTDVLEWLSLVGMDFTYSFSAKGKIYGYSKLMDLSLIVEDTKIDLTKPYLKDQSKEVIDFLYNFIENEKTP
ncbi:hypothetical protein PG608_00420 [Riemerella anatipestifer]|uniref:hypothetical protein n=1 Tax=Riemerella anatipestifer TaxID=34085 RepID=UPI002859C540|nr:hypothetical protein [Riemerella anatipestifer]MDR7782924.1 hypothetical protein [Riemerella anatipestifer]MDY3389743.1 hypothetical protein [Riemerella anatipestifer]MDY3517685.1 hypothetical protein [Riemerella anatipestifer]MDY3542616.1 hypothetical protein [Riemerella anatipestifer]